jgi:hypothetical protein
MVLIKILNIKIERRRLPFHLTEILFLSMMLTTLYIEVFQLQRWNAELE